MLSSPFILSIAVLNLASSAPFCVTCVSGKKYGKLTSLNWQEASKKTQQICLMGR